jgi:ribosomal protein S18 acetylase RimI-like enzyme
MTPSSDPEPAAPAAVRRMTAEEYADWEDGCILSYADDVSKANDIPLEVALDRARTQFTELLPHGLDSPGTWLMRVLDEGGEPVGVLWLGPHRERDGVIYVYDVEIDEPHRGRGLGRAAMLAAERLVRESGAHEIGLNVFGFNEPAKRLYDSLGYRVIATQMTKVLTDEPTDREPTDS